jgi:hypothetical protein
VNDLRKKGYVIENKDMGIIDGERHTAFRLVYEPSPLFTDRVGQYEFCK